ncbi:MAG TPA: ABC transporter substrate-binding protein [Polyangiaceae bacterium]|nr:ABC transporter substrate-binding protein [Polyangiaceae bacterium]
MTRLRAHVVAFCAVLLLPFVLRAWLGRSEPRARAQSDAPVAELRIITPHNQDIRRAFELAFSDWHLRHYGQAVAITFLSPGGTNEIVRYLGDAYGAYRDRAGQLLPEAQINVGIEIVWGGGDYTFERDFKPILKPLSITRQLLDEVYPEPDLAGVSLFDPDARDRSRAPKWVGVVLSSFGLIYAPEVYGLLGLPAPETWSDLARPELAGLLALADPTRSGTAAVVYMMVLQRAMAAAERVWLEQNPTSAGADVESLPGYRAALAAGWKDGMRVLVLMAANARYFTDSASRPCADVGDAESAAGVAIDFYARVYQEQIGQNRIRFHAPRGATAITPDPVGILYGTTGEHESVANHFVEFLLSREGQRLWNLDAGQSPYVPRSLRRMPARRDVYADRSGFADADNPFELAEGFNMRQRWMRQLGRLLPIWGAAWMDAKSQLDEAYRAVLALPDPARRARLSFELSDLPIEYDEVLAKAPVAADGVDPRLAAARDRVQLGERFRSHYARVLAEARGAP